MLADLACPACKKPLMVSISGVLFGAQSQIEVTPHPFSMRVHAKCFGGPDGGQPLLLLRVA